MEKKLLQSFTTIVLITLTAGLFALPDSARADGSILSWGKDNFGQVSNTPTETGFSAIAGGGQHSLALRADGSIVSWGKDDFGQVSNTPAESDFTAIAGGGDHSLALRADGSIISWGRDGVGQVSNTPAESDFTAISGGVGHSLALRADGSIVSWGNDGDGQVSNTPTETGFTAIAGGGHHSLALRADGSIVSWGRDDLGQVSKTPAETGFTAIAGGNQHSLALLGPHFLNPNPADGSTVSVSVNQLQWTLPETGPSGGIVTCDVWFGTDPDVENNPKVVIRQAVESVSVTLAPDTTYYWALDLYDSASSTPDTPYMLCPVFTFTAVSNFPPVVNAGGDIVSWLVEGSRVIELDGMAVDEDGVIEPLAVLWTMISEPNELNPAEISDPDVLNATVTVKEPGTYTLQLEAYDGEYTVSDTVKILVYADSCEHAQNQTGFKWLAADISRDCKVDFLDLANLAVSWLDEYYSIE